MAVITPIIDTLLHNVLGKRMDNLPRREMSQAVRPVEPRDGAPALRSDSRLDSRRSPLENYSRTGKVGDPPPRPSQQHSTEQRGSGAFETRLSPAARTIRDVFARFPAPPPALHSSAPLLGVEALSSALGRGSSTDQVRDALKYSIRESGLFYESHLRHWFQGRLSTHELAREPQMRLAPLQLPGRSAGELLGGSHRSGADISAPAHLPTGSAVAHSGEKVHPVGPKGIASADPLPFSGETDDDVSPLLRHQLELLANPTLRWEGEVCAGIFMVLSIKPPASRGDDPASQHQEAGSSADEWSAELNVDVAGVGEIAVVLNLSEEALALTITAPSPEVLAMLEAEKEALAGRLTTLGYPAPAVSIDCSMKGDVR